MPKKIVATQKAAPKRDGKMRKHNSAHQLVILCVKMLLMEMVVSQNTTKIKVNVGVVLDMDTWHGQMGLSCLSMALSDFYASHGHYNTRLVLHKRDSKNDTVAAAAAALDLIKNVEVQAIIGPVMSMQADFIVDLGEKALVPIITFSATSPSISSIRSPYFFRVAVNDSSQVHAISATMQTFGWKEAVLIYVDNEYGEGVIPFLMGALQQVDTRVTYRSAIASSATDDQLGKELDKLLAMQTRVFIVHMLPPLSSRLFKKAGEMRMMSEGYVWIVTDGIGNLLNTLDPSVIYSMQGVLGVKTYVPNTKVLEDFTIRWKKKFQQDHPTILNLELNVLGLWAYDAALALAMAVENVNATSFSFQKSNSILENSTDLETLGFSRIGPKLCLALLSTKFRGLTGDFHLVDGKLQSSAFEIVNVVENGARRIGFWHPRSGISRKLKFTNTNSARKEKLRPVVWPGETKLVPNGWVPTKDGRRLRIGIPVKEGFYEFVKVWKDPITHTMSFTGYCIDFFKAVVEAMPCDVPYDLFPYMLPNGTSAGSSDDLIYQVYLKNYDAIVGDITIRANRSLYVAFTLHYTESGISMVVPIKDNKSKNALAFLKPLTWELWMTSACFFVFVGFVIWVLEHRINEDFRGPPLQQIGTAVWFSFSTMTFSHKEKVISNLARFVVIVWLFVVLILTQSYTASLSSMLTVQQLQPTISDVNELIKRGEYVGYQKDSFVFEFLKRMNIDESKLRPYVSSETCNEMLSKGSANGGVAAVFDEIPYMRLFLEKYHSKYTIVGPRYKADGFGFVFPMGSPLVSDFSRAILHVNGGDKVEEIEKKWFGRQINCQALTGTSVVSSHDLGLYSFWGLFLIAGIASISVFIIYAATLLFKDKDVLMHSYPKVSLWKKIAVILRHFDQKDNSSHHLRKCEMQDKSFTNVMDHNGAVEASPNKSCPKVSPRYSIHRDTNVIFLQEQGTPSSGYGEPSLISQTPQEQVSVVELVTTNQESSGNRSC